MSSDISGIGPILPPKPITHKTGQLHYIYFKDKFTFEKRCEEYDKVHQKFPDKIPIIVEKGNDETYDIDQHKYLVPTDGNVSITMGHFASDIRKRLKLKQDESLFFFINNTIPTMTQPLITIYKNNKDKDGFLYIRYSCESTFG
jgi:GABA(A) receptor-associated protein